jgi:3-hydroxy acid dehydrogenase / malonic semialdehyde reductase
MLSGSIVITGASSGIGAATARALAHETNLKFVLCGRRKDRLEELASELTAAGRTVSTLVFDVADRDAVQKAFNSLSSDFQDINYLLNNAGNAHGLAPFQDGDYKDWQAMIDSNVMGLLFVSEWVCQGMVARKKGHIINISSIAGREAYANGAVYCASKAAVDKITAGMRIDLNPFGIKVAALAPGMVETEFSLVRFKGDTEKAAKVYADMVPLSPADVADTIVWMLRTPPHVNVADVLLLPTAQASATVVKRG